MRGFDLYFRRNPFGGEYTVFAGLEECIRFIANFKLSKDEIAFVRECLSPTCEVSINQVESKFTGMFGISLSFRRSGTGADMVG
jgi:nicotinic acid phosphoribosyltransferase